MTKFKALTLSIATGFIFATPAVVKAETSAAAIDVLPWMMAKGGNSGKGGGHHGGSDGHRDRGEFEHRGRGEGEFEHRGRGRGRGGFDDDHHRSAGRHGDDDHRGRGEFERERHRSDDHFGDDGIHRHRGGDRDRSRIKIHSDGRIELDHD